MVFDLGKDLGAAVAASGAFPPLLRGEEKPPKRGTQFWLYLVKNG